MVSLMHVFRSPNSSAAREEGEEGITLEEAIAHRKDLSGANDITQKGLGLFVVD